MTAALAVSGVAPAVASRPHPFLAGFNTVTTVASTVPANGDVNPYGIVNVPQSGQRSRDDGATGAGGDATNRPGGSSHRFLSLVRCGVGQ